MRSSEDHTIEKEKPVFSAPKSSLGESVIERMRKLKLDANENGQHDEVGAECSSKSQNTLKIGFGLKNGHTNASATPPASSFLNPRPAPETPLAKQERLSSGSSINRRVSIQGLVVSKVHAGLGTTEDQSRSTSVGSQNRPTSVGAPNSFYSVSSIPRPLRNVSAAGSPNIDPGHCSPTVLQLKRVRGQIGDRVQYTSALEHVGQTITPLSKAHNGPADQTSIGLRQSSLPLPERLMRHTQNNTNIRQSDEPLAVKQECSPEPEVKLERFSQESLKTIKHEFDDDSPMRTFKFPEAPTEDVNNDNGSVVTRSCSISSATSGTIYAYDQFGSFRLKPVSVSNPKHGPRVRIEDSADHLLLDDESLNKCNAKREAYEKRYRTVVNTNADKDLPEFAGLCTVSEPSKGENTKVGRQNDCVDSKTPPVGTTTNDKNLFGSPGAKRLAPSIPVNIPLLSHSPTGWPLLVSKIAPFAEISPEEQSPKSIGKRISASESNLRSASATPAVTPIKGTQISGEQSPASAYTLRTALSKGPCGSLVKKSRRSFPSITAARPLFPPRSSSKIRANDSSSTKSITSLRKQTSDLLKSSGNQRAELKSSPSGHKYSDNNTATQTQQQVQVTRVATSSPTRHMQSYNDSVRYMNAHEDVDSNLPSSPVAIPDTVHMGKGVMLNIKGLFHKHSSDKILKSDSNGSLHLSRRASARNVSEAFKPSPLRSTFDPSTPDTGNGKKPAVNSSIKRKFPRLHRDKIECHTSPDHSTTDRQPSSPQPFVTSALEPLEIRDATALAFTLLDKARDGASPGMQHDYVELAKLLVTTVTLSREAEKAMEEARQAAARAEMETVKTRQSVAEVTEKVREVLAKQSKS